MFYCSQTSGTTLDKGKFRCYNSNPIPRRTVTIFTDGACSFNPGPGGWAARLLYGDGRVVELGGFAPGDN